MQSIFNAKYLKALFQGLIFLVTMSASSPSEAQNFRQGAAFWIPPNGGSQCKASFSGIGPFSLDQKLTRRPYPNDDAVNFSNYYGMLLAQIVANRDVKQSKAAILKAANMQAYTKANFSSRWSPIYVQSNLIRTTAMFITALEKRGNLTGEERATLINWGDRMISGQKGSRGNKSADSRMASGVALISWGSIKGDKALMKAGYRKYMSGYKYILQSVGRLNRHSAHQGISKSLLSLEDEYNVAIQHAVEGVAILRNLGLDITTVKANGQNFHSAIEWWATVIASEPKGFKGNTSWGHNFHLGWIPIYLSIFPNQSSSRQLNRLSRKASGGRVPSYRAVSLAGSTDCLW